MKSCSALAEVDLMTKDEYNRMTATMEPDEPKYDDEDDNLGQSKAEKPTGKLGFGEVLILTVRK